MSFQFLTKFTQGLKIANVVFLQVREQRANNRELFANQVVVIRDLAIKILKRPDRHQHPPAAVIRLRRRQPTQPFLIRVRQAGELDHDHLVREESVPSAGHLVPLLLLGVLDLRLVADETDW